MKSIRKNNRTDNQPHTPQTNTYFSIHKRLLSAISHYMKNTEKGKYYYLIRLDSRIIEYPKMIKPRLPLFKFDVIMLHFCAIPKYRQKPS